MPTNLLKQYPDLLELFGSEDNMKRSLRGIFDRDISNSDLKFLNEKVYPIKSQGENEMNRTFAHLTTCKDENQTRCFDYDRSQRLHWIKPHLENTVCDKDPIIVFDLQERDQKSRTNIFRYYIYNKNMKYVVVLEPQRNGGYYLLTAYYLNKKYAQKQINKKYEKFKKAQGSTNIKG